MPIYEDPAKRKKGPERDHGHCEQHPEAGSIAKCSRCDKPVCQTCKTRWHDETVCPQCVDNSVADDEPSPQEAQLQTKQAWVGVMLAAGAWLLLILTLGPFAAFFGPQPARSTIIFLAYFCYLGSFVPAVFGLGHAIAAMRLRGDSEKLALGGLIASGTHLALALGFIVLGLWHI